MDVRIFDDFKFVIDPEKIKKRIHFNDSEDIELIEDYCADAQKIARPKAAMAVVFIDELADDRVMLGNVTFNSRLLVENLSETKKVIPYILTCGTEIYEWAKRIDDFIGVFVGEEIKIEALRCVSEFFDDYIKKYIYPEKSSVMNPGSLEDWPLTEQKKMFRLLEGPAQTIGVKLTDSCLMIPDKSVSGIVFQKEKSFINCMLCGMKNCPGRRAEYGGHEI
jgi:hypothetical protein